MAAPLALPPALAGFIELFNQGNYWESHEALEAEWRRTRSSFYHGLILYASAWVHAQRGNRPGVLAQLAKAEPHLGRFVPTYLGIDVVGLLRAGAGLRAGGIIAEPRILANAALVRGDEPELGRVD